MVGVFHTKYFLFKSKVSKLALTASTTTEANANSSLKPRKTKDAHFVVPDHTLSALLFKTAHLNDT